MWMFAKMTLQFFIYFCKKTRLPYSLGAPLAGALFSSNPLEMKFLDIRRNIGRENLELEEYSIPSLFSGWGYVTGKIYILWIPKPPFKTWNRSILCFPLPISIVISQIVKIVNPYATNNEGLLYLCWKRKKKLSRRFFLNFIFGRNVFLAYFLPFLIPNPMKRYSPRERSSCSSSKDHTWKI